jgi:hypothetical protein
VVYNLRVADHRTYFVGDDTWSFAAWAHNAYLALQQITTEDATGMGYARAAWHYRMHNRAVNPGLTPANRNYWAAGGHNIGYVTTRRQQYGPYSSGVRHSEPTMIDALTPLGVPSTQPIVSMFSERSPCPSCLRLLRAWVAPQQQPGTVILYYIIPYAAGSPDHQGTQLLAQYQQLGSANW